MESSIRPIVEKPISNVCRACVDVTSEGNARVCREGPVFALGDVAFEAGEPATVGVH